MHQELIEIAEEGVSLYRKQLVNLDEEEIKLKSRLSDIANARIKIRKKCDSLSTYKKKDDNIEYCPSCYIAEGIEVELYPVSGADYDTFSCSHCWILVDVCKQESSPT